MVRYVDFRDNGFKRLHEISEALPIGVIEVPEIRSGGFLASKHDIVLEESRREVVKTVDEIFLKAGESVESDFF